MGNTKDLDSGPALNDICLRSANLLPTSITAMIHRTMFSGWVPVKRTRSLMDDATQWSALPPHTLTPKAHSKAKYHSLILNTLLYIFCK